MSFHGTLPAGEFIKNAEEEYERRGAGGGGKNSKRGYRRIENDGQWRKAWVISQCHSNVCRSILKRFPKCTNHQLRCPHRPS